LAPWPADNLLRLPDDANGVVPFGFTDRSDLGLAAGGAVGAGAAGDGQRERLVAGFGQGGQALDGELAFGQGHGRRTLETAAGLAQPSARRCMTSGAPWVIVSPTWPPEPT
jgi:hypothetical protein